MKVRMPGYRLYSKLLADTVVEEVEDRNWRRKEKALGRMLGAFRSW
jgi:hypothetical protein